jgi:hypothetical protein
MAQTPVMDLLGDVAQVCRQAPTPTLIAAYVRAARRFCGKSRWLVVSIQGQTTAGEPRYTLGSDPYAEIFGIAGITLYESATKYAPLVESDSKQWSPTAAPGLPEFYQYLPEAQVALHVTPNAAYDMTIGACVKPKRGANSIDASLATKWEYVLQHGALSYLLALPSVAWSDPRMAQIHEAQFLEGCGDAANAASLGFDPGATPIRVRPA